MYDCMSLLQYRLEQHDYIRGGFAFTYLLLGSMLSSFLIEVASVDRFTWTCNVASDVVLVGIFMIYGKNVHVKRSHEVAGREGWSAFLFPADSYVNFPGYFGATMGVLLAGRMR